MLIIEKKLLRGVLCLTAAAMVLHFIALADIILRASTPSASAEVAGGTHTIR